MADEKEITVETVHGVKTTVPKDWCKKKCEKKVKEGVDKDDTV